MVKELSVSNFKIICDLNYRGGWSWGNEPIIMDKQTVRVRMTYDGKKVYPTDPRYKDIIKQCQNPFPGYETEFL